MPSVAAMRTIEELYGKELSGLLSEGLDWIARYSLYPTTQQPEQSYNPTQAIIAAAILALTRKDIEAFSRIDRAENLSFFQYPYMKSWLKDDHKFSKRIVLKCLTTLAWLVVEEKICPQSPLIAAVTGLEEKYNLCGMFVQTVVSCAKQAWKVSQGNQKTATEIKSISTQTCFEVTEALPEFRADVNNYDRFTSQETTLYVGNSNMIKIQVQVGAGKLRQIISVKKLLQQAVESESAKTVDTLMKLCGNIKNNDESISSLLHIAAKRKNTKVMRILLWHGLDNHFLDEKGNAPLHIAAAANHLRTVRLLTSKGADVTQANIFGQLPLHLTTDPKIIVHLLERGTDVDSKTPAGDTALHLAVFNNNKEAVETLIKFGAKPNAKNGNGLTPLLMALQSENQEMVDVLTEPSFTERFCHVGEPVYKVAIKGRLEILKEVSEEEKTNIRNNHSEGSLLDLSWDLNKDQPIHKAAAEGRLDVVMELLDRGVEVDTKGYGGYTVLQYAAKYGHLNVVQSLLQRGADINLSNDWNWTPLHHAAYYNRHDIVQFLLETGADTQVVDNVYGMTPLSWATHN